MNRSLAIEQHTSSVREDILTALREADGGLTHGTIVTVTHTSRTAVHRYLRELREAGKVEAYRDPDDRRIVRYRFAGGESTSEVCPECGRNVTKSPTRPGVEYGHQRENGSGDNRDRCSKRPDCVDPVDPRTGRPP